MSYIDKKRFVNDHYLGLPANLSAKFILKRISLLREISDFIGNNLTLVDVGCGNGATVLTISDEFKYSVGLDIFSENKIVFEQLKESKKIINCDFKLMDFENEKLNTQFDRLICFEVLEHLKEEQSIKNIFNLLKPGGKAAFTVPNKWWIFEQHGAKLPLLPWNRVPFFSWLPTPIHERWANARIYSKKRIINLLKSTGFQVIKASLITAPLDVLKDGKLKRFLLKTVFKKNTTKVPFLATTIFIHVEKPFSNSAI